jgi:hypothetical protein
MYGNVMMKLLTINNLTYTNKKHKNKGLEKRKG